MLSIRRVTGLRAVVLLWVSILLLQVSSPASAVTVRMECDVSACDDTCSLLRCIGAAECAMSGSCDFDSNCPGFGLRVTCDDYT